MLLAIIYLKENVTNAVQLGLVALFVLREDALTVKRGTILIMERARSVLIFKDVFQANARLQVVNSVWTGCT